MKKVIISFLLITALLLSFGACGKNNDNTDEATDVQKDTSVVHRINLAYSFDDTLNPFVCRTTANKNIMGLIFDSLYTVNSSFEIQPRIARSASTTDLQLKVTIKNGMKFSDKSPITVNDIVKSFNLAKNSPVYSSVLDNISEASVKDSTTVVFTLKKSEPNMQACLDFPIVKEIQKGYIGSGRYKIKDKNTLVVNPLYDGSKGTKNKSVKLVQLPKGDGLYHSVEIGAVSAYYDDLSSGVVKSITANATEIPTNNFVFLAFNTDGSSALSDKNIRKAISLAIPRDIIASSSFQSHANPTVLPCNPKWADAQKVKDSEFTADINEAEAIIKKAGYRKDSAGIYYKDDNYLSFSMLVNDDNAFKVSAANEIISSLKKIGINITLYSMGKESYINTINSKSFNMFLGEVKLRSNMSLLPFFDEDNEVSAGMDYYGVTAKAYEAYLNGEKTYSDFIKAYRADIPFASICFRNGVLYYTRELADNIIGSDSDVYENIFLWHFNKSF